MESLCTLCYLAEVPGYTKPGDLPHAWVVTAGLGRCLNTWRQSLGGEEIASWGCEVIELGLPALGRGNIAGDFEGGTGEDKFWGGGGNLIGI